VSGKSTQLDLDTDVTISNFSELRQTTVYSQSERLGLAETPVTEPVAGHVIELDQFYEGLSVGQNIVVTGERDDLAGVKASEVATLAEVTHDTAQGLTTLTLAGDLVNQYRRDTVTINANIARATNGETVQEVLGSADASQSYQRFTLRQPPLTHTSAATPSGNRVIIANPYQRFALARSDVAVRPRPRRTHLHLAAGRGRQDHCRVRRWAHRRAVATGQENVRATYRKGIGRGGLVKAEQISLLLTRHWRQRCNQSAGLERRCDAETAGRRARATHR